MQPMTACLRLAEAQHGMISRAQALVLGMSKDAIHRAVVSGKWRRVAPGVYRLCRGLSPWHERLSAACLWAGERAAASHRAAARLWALEGCMYGNVEITSGRRIGRARPWLTHHYSVDFPTQEVTRRLGIRTTTVARTLVDISAVIPSSRLEVALEDGLRRGLTTTDQLAATLDRLGGSGRHGSALLRRLIDERRSDGRCTDNGFETKVRRLLLNEGLPSPIAQFVVLDGTRFVARIDLAYPRQRIGIEPHGFKWHSGRAAWKRDTDRLNDLLRLGWYIRFVTPDELTDHPRRIVADVRSALAARSR